MPGSLPSGISDVANGGGARSRGVQLDSNIKLTKDLELRANGAVDANTDISNSHWTLRLFAKNLTDKRAYLTAFSFPDLSGGVVVQNEAPCCSRGRSG